VRPATEMLVFRMPARPHSETIIISRMPVSGTGPAAWPNRRPHERDWFALLQSLIVSGSLHWPLIPQ